MAVYVAWIVFCAALAVALRVADDPSRRPGRILSLEAGRQALMLLRASDPVRYGNYEVVHVAATEGRWIVLCDRVPHTALREAVVVEVRQEDGVVVAMRRIEN